MLNVELRFLYIQTHLLVKHCGVSGIKHDTGNQPTSTFFQRVLTESYVIPNYTDTQKHRKKL